MDYINSELQRLYKIKTLSLRWKGYYRQYKSEGFKHDLPPLDFEGAESEQEELEIKYAYMQKVERTLKLAYDTIEKAWIEYYERNPWAMFKGVSIPDLEGFLQSIFREANKNEI